MNAAGISFLRSAAEALIASDPNCTANGNISAFVKRVVALHVEVNGPTIDASTVAPVQTQSLDWQAFRPGVEMIHLCAAGDGGPSAALLRYESSGAVPHHRHVGDEYVLVLDGSQADERGHYPRGTLVHNVAGSCHSVVSSAGCLVAIFWEKPIVFTSVASS